jgi:putative transposase
MQSNATTVRRTFRYRLFPTKAQATTMERLLDLCRELYNGAVQERRDAWRLGRTSIHFAGQSAQLPAIKHVRPDLTAVYSQTLQDVLHRVDKAFQAFYARCQRGEKAGYPRFKPWQRYNSFTYPQLGWTLDDDRLTLTKIGTVRVVKHRPILGKVKTCQIVREGRKWYCCIAVELEASAPTVATEAIGVDVGLEYFATLSNGETIANPRYFRQSERRLAKAQRRLAKIARTDPKRQQARQRVGAAHRRVRNQRQNFLHQTSHALVSRFNPIVVENLSIKGLASGMLAKSVNDAAWGRLLFMLAYKAEEAGTRLVAVTPRGTSQTCPDCGTMQAKPLSERWHRCDCGASMPRDLASARIILTRGLASLGTVALEAPGL